MAMVIFCQYHFPNMVSVHSVQIWSVSIFGKWYHLCLHPISYVARHSWWHQWFLGRQQVQTPPAFLATTDSWMLLYIKAVFLWFLVPAKRNKSLGIHPKACTAKVRFELIRQLYITGIKYITYKYNIMKTFLLKCMVWWQGNFKETCTKRNL